MSIRALTGFDRPYYEINREERHLAAVFFHALLLGNNLERFLRRVGCDYPWCEEEAGMYFEYAYLRDLWEERGGSNEEKRALITALLDTDDVRGLGSASTAEWNAHFGAAASSRAILSPARWALTRYDANIESNDDFLRTCRFKWSFNIKPDIVIHTTNSHAVCIEAKLESPEGSYPASNAEKAIFKGRGVPCVGQTELQEEMFRRLLGVDATFVYLVQNAKAASRSHRTLTWSQAFAELDLGACPRAVQRLIARRSSPGA